MSNINKIMEAYLSMQQSVSEEVEAVETLEEAKTEETECPKCEGKGCDHCGGDGVHEKTDPVDDKEAKGKFADRKDKDIDNDGDTDSSDEYLHKRRRAIARASTKDIKHNSHTADRKAEISKIESVSTKEAFEAFWSELEEAVKPKAKEGEKPEDTMQPETKRAKDAHDGQSDKKIENDEEDGHTKTFKAGGKDMKQAPSRGNDNLSNGDKSPVKGK